MKKITSLFLFVFILLFNSSCTKKQTKEDFLNESSYTCVLSITYLNQHVTANKTIILSTIHTNFYLSKPTCGRKYLYMKINGKDETPVVLEPVESFRIVSIN